MRRDFIESCVGLLLAVLVIATAATAAKVIDPPPLELRIEALEKRVAELEKRPTLAFPSPGDPGICPPISGGLYIQNHVTPITCAHANTVTTCLGWRGSKNPNKTRCTDCGKEW